MIKYSDMKTRITGLKQYMNMHGCTSYNTTVDNVHKNSINSLQIYPSPSDTVA